MPTKVQNIIIKYYGNSEKNEWEKCGQEIDNLIREKRDVIKEKNYRYNKERHELDKIQDKIAEEYHQYFRIGSGYNWVHGNNLLKELLENVCMCRNL